MRTNRIAATAAGIAALTIPLAACSSSSDSGSGSSMSSTTVMSSTMMPSMSAPTAMASHGTFGGLNGKNVAGTAEISGSTVTLAGFSSDEGPDLHIYLTEGTTEADVAAGSELGPVAYDKASQTFMVPGGVDASMFTDVVVHCDKAKAVFGAAELAK